MAGAHVQTPFLPIDCVRHSQRGLWWLNRNICWESWYLPYPSIPVSPHSTTHQVCLGPLICWWTVCNFCGHCPKAISGFLEVEPFVVIYLSRGCVFSPDIPHVFRMGKSPHNLANLTADLLWNPPFPFCLQAWRMIGRELPDSAPPATRFEVWHDSQICWRTCCSPRYYTSPWGQYSSSPKLRQRKTIPVHHHFLVVDYKQWDEWY